MPVPAAARLVEFKVVSGGDQAHASAHSFARIKPNASTSVVDQPEPVAAAFLRGRYQGLDDARVEYEEKLKAAEAAFEQRLAADRATWAAGQGAVFAQQIEAAFEALGADVGDAVTLILTPFVDEKLRVRIVQELLRTLEKVLKAGRPTTLKISGPDDLLLSIQKTLGPAASAIEFEITNAIDVCVVADRTVIETQLEAWLQQISGRSE